MTYALDTFIFMFYCTVGSGEIEVEKKHEMLFDYLFYFVVEKRKCRELEYLEYFSNL